MGRTGAVSVRKEVRKVVKWACSCLYTDYSGDMGALVRKISQNSTEVNLQDLDDEYTEEELKDAFEVFDRDGDGTIRATECRQVMANLGVQLDDDKEKQLMHHDRINFDQFAKAM